MSVRFSILALGLLASSGAAAATATVNQSDGIALRGFDPVAYFRQHKPVRGNPEITVERDGVKYEFASEADRAEFLRNPTAYLPQYGGFCAFAVSEEKLKVDVDPHAFAIVDGKLYLNFNEDLRDQFAKKAKADVPKGDANWVEVSKQATVIR